MSERRSPSTGRRPLAGQDGFTIVEVMVAMVVMLIGVLATLVLIEGSVASTNKTTAREAGTNVARDLIERSREAPYTSMTTSAAPATLRAMLPASDNATALSGSTFKVTRRNNVLYTVNVFACSIDDPTDGIGVGDATFCAAPTPSSVIAPGSATPGSAAAVNVLGISVALGGSLLGTVCNALAPGPILSQLTALVSPLAGISVCPAGGSGASSAQYDSNPDDLRRVRVDVSWTAGGTPGSVSQTTLLTNPLQG